MGGLTARLVSGNEHKLHELRSVLSGWRIDLLDADQPPPEDGDTYLANARIKARFGRSVGPPEAWILADDSGIEVAALDGAPGVRSARWAGGDHVGRVLEALAGAPAGRRACYVCELVALSPDGQETRGTGRLEGAITAEPHGTGGFGFDPVFVPDGETLTVAELGDAWKREHSHRARAARALSEALAAARPHERRRASG